MSVTNTTISALDSVGNLRSTTLQVALGAGYPTGGEPLAPSAFQMSQIRRVDLELVTPIAAIGGVKYDRTNNKLLAYTTAGAEVANATNLTGAVVEATAYGF